MKTLNLESDEFYALTNKDRKLIAEYHGWQHIKTLRDVPMENSVIGIKLGCETYEPLPKYFHDMSAIREVCKAWIAQGKSGYVRRYRQRLLRRILRQVKFLDFGQKFMFQKATTAQYAEAYCMAAGHRLGFYDHEWRHERCGADADIVQQHMWLCCVTVVIAITAIVRFVMEVW